MWLDVIKRSVRACAPWLSQILLSRHPNNDTHNQELREAQAALEAKSDGSSNNEMDLEIFMAIRERVEEELEEARGEGFALMGPDYDVVEKEEEKAERRRRGVSGSGGKCVGVGR